MSLKPCKECKEKISDSAKVCPRCGKKDPHGASERLATGMGFGCVGIVAFFMLLGTCDGTSSRPSTSAIAPYRPDTIAARMRRERITRDSLRVDSVLRNTNLAGLRRLPATTIAELSVHRGDPALKPKIDRASVLHRENVARESAERRREWARKYERLMLGQGRDVTARADGPNATTLRITYILIGRPTAYQLMNDASFVGNLRSEGFRRVVLSDGYDSRYSFDIPE